jgi:hypothetical protein
MAVSSRFPNTYLYRPTAGIITQSYLHIVRKNGFDAGIDCLRDFLPPPRLAGNPKYIVSEFVGVRYDPLQKND